MSATAKRAAAYAATFGAATLAVFALGFLAGTSTVPAVVPAPPSVDMQTAVYLGGGAVQLLPDHIRTHRTKPSAYSPHAARA